VSVFTGLVKAVGTVHGARRTTSGMQLAVALGPLATSSVQGDSISVSGVCLTVAAIEGERATFDVVVETVNRSTLAELQAGGRVNLEPALRVGEALGGHFVSGHVDGTCQLARLMPVGDGVELVFTAGGEILADIVPKGSVAVDGISLTVAGIGDGAFRVAVIPHTLRETTLGDLRPGMRANVETDMLVKAVRAMLGAGTAGESALSEDFLRRHGYA
jgi:riboflavin synthase